MVSFRVSLLSVALFAIGSYSKDYIGTIDPQSVDEGTRDSWCISQKSACPLLCLQLQGEDSTTVANDCYPDTLTYECICGNGLTPNASEYSQTLPFFLCQAYGERCVRACDPANTPCQTACRVDNLCGAQSPTRYNLTTTSSTQVATATGAESTDGVVYNGLGGSAEATETAAAVKGNGAQTAFDLGQSYGLAVVFASIFAGFALVM